MEWTMAFTRTRYPWEREVEMAQANCRKSFTSKNELLYVVHPGSDRFDGDPNEVAKESIHNELRRAERRNIRAILTYPVREGVYIDTSLVTDVRGGADEREWVKPGDLDDTRSVTLTGGKLERCLGYIYRSIYRLAKQKGLKHLSVRLPLGAIYTTQSKFTAEQWLLELKKNHLKYNGVVMSDRDAIKAILSTNYRDEYPILNPHSTGINVSCNGKRIMELANDGFGVRKSGCEESGPLTLDINVEHSSLPSSLIWMARKLMRLD